MERKNIHWLTVLIVAAFAVCGGFVAGSLLGIRERGLLKGKNAALAQTEVRTLERLSESENKNGELSAELETAQTDIEQWRSECTRLKDGVAKGFDREASFHPPMLLDAESFENENRIVALEREVASLRELASQNHTTPDEPPASLPPPGITLAKTPEASSVKEQCTAITKKGSRCSRPARSSGKCWQHGG